MCFFLIVAFSLFRFDVHVERSLIRSTGERITLRWLSFYNLHVDYKWLLIDGKVSGFIYTITR